MHADRALIESLASRLREAGKSGIPCAPVRDQLAENDVASAYAIQLTNTKFWLAEGRRLVGRKIGLTTLAVQKQMGISEPDFGMLFDDMGHGDGQEISLGKTYQPKIEAEVSLVLEQDLTMERPNFADVIRATAYAVASIEVVATRIRDWDIRLTDTIADNASSGLFVLGGRPVGLKDVDLRRCSMTTERRGEIVSTGAGAACLGNPLNAAVWLARKMVEVGMPMRAGDIIMTGALGPMVSVAAGDIVEVTLTGLGSVRGHFVA